MLDALLAQQTLALPWGVTSAGVLVAIFGAGRALQKISDHERRHHDHDERHKDHVKHIEELREEVADVKTDTGITRAVVERIEQRLNK